MAWVNSVPQGGHLFILIRSTSGVSLDRRSFCDFVKVLSEKLTEFTLVLSAVILATYMRHRRGHPSPGLRLTMTLSKAELQSFFLEKKGNGDLDLFVRMLEHESNLRVDERKWLSARKAVPQEDQDYAEWPLSRLLQSFIVVLIIAIMPGAGAKARRPSRRARVRISRERNPGEPEKWLKPKRHTPRAPWKRRKARREKEAAAAAADDTTVAAQMYIEPTNDDTHDDSEELEGEDESDEGDDQEEKRESGCDSEEYIRVPVRIVKDRVTAIRYHLQDLLLGLPSSRKVALEFSAPFSELEAYDLKADVIKGTKIDSTLRAISSRAAVPAELKERSSAILRKWEAASARL
ncbi:hypothetical protein JOL62DRAFT_619249 [Phyllosticta paracitricarpa]|uniref:Uncharacterized protein n=2 Tax=Phyllosticta TaxID=121621 RepID=A0ABR1MGI1_9PEZI